MEGFLPTKQRSLVGPLPLEGSGVDLHTILIEVEFAGALEDGVLVKAANAVHLVRQPVEHQLPFLGAIAGNSWFSRGLGSARGDFREGVGKVVPVLADLEGGLLGATLEAEVVG